MDSFIQWLADVIWFAHEHRILASAIALGIVSLIAYVVFQILRLWRVESRLVEPQISDVVVRMRLYLMAADEGGPATRTRDHQYLREAIDRWTAERAHVWTDFQLYVAVRQMKRFMKKPSIAGNPAVEQLRKALRAALVAAPGDPDMNPAWAILNHGIATFLGMHPSVRYESIARRPAGHTDVHPGSGDPRAVLGLSDPYAIENRIVPMLDAGDEHALGELLAEAEAGVLDSGFVTVGGSHPLRAELVLWILHQERVGPFLLTARQRALRETMVQLDPQLPAFLRGKPMRSLEQAAPNQLLLTLSGAEPPVAYGNESASAFNFGLTLELAGHQWIANSVDFEIGSAATLVFRRVDSKRGRLASAVHVARGAEG